MVEIFNTDYSEHIDIVGTAHFTRRSINDAYELIESLKPKDVALELDYRRFHRLYTACLSCPRKESCSGICEFTGAAEALGNADANLWLIDMTEQEIMHRIRSNMTPFERSHRRFLMHENWNEDAIQLWEKGFKKRVIDNSKRQIEALRSLSPSTWRVLIDERNVLMAARLAWLASSNLDERKNSKILAFVGAAHVEGIIRLLVDPILIKERLREFNLPFTEPTLVRRVAIQ